MGRVFEQLDEKLIAWIGKQPMVFVASAPNEPDGHVNLSPKGDTDTFRILGPTTFAYLDLLGSGVETIAHLRENGRIVVMFCAFDGAPKVLRLHGRGRVVQAHDPEFADLVAAFEPSEAIMGILRSVILVEITRIADSCGFVVPKMALVEEREQLVRWGEHQEAENGDGWKEKYFFANNQASIDGLTGLDFPEGDPDLDERERKTLTSAGKSL
ncbi:MAG: pyridoxamine 5'-phosphate oxidase family protein [Thermomicrobiales bacterium]